MSALYTTAIGLGLRHGELLGLRSRDVDLDAGVLAVRNSLQRGKRKLTEPKTECARRTLVMPAMVTAAPRDHRHRQLEERLAAGDRWQDEGYVFATPRGSSLDPRSVARSFQAAFATAGLPRQRFHDMRHACAALLIEQGEELGVVSRLLGHANLATSADVYAHLTRECRNAPADRMDAILSRAGAV